jgi:hypothetical protein
VLGRPFGARKSKLRSPAARQKTLGQVGRAACTGRRSEVPGAQSGFVTLRPLFRSSRSHRRESSRGQSARAAGAAPPARPGTRIHGRSTTSNLPAALPVPGGAMKTPQDAEKPVWPVIPRSRRRRGISHVLCLQSEIPPLRSALGRNDNVHKRFSAPCWSLVTAEGHAVETAPPFPFQSVLGVELRCRELFVHFSYYFRVCHADPALPCLGGKAQSEILRSAPLRSEAVTFLIFGSL